MAIRRLRLERGRRSSVVNVQSALSLIPGLEMTARSGLVTDLYLVKSSMICQCLTGLKRLKSAKVVRGALAGITLGINVK